MEILIHRKTAKLIEDLECEEPRNVVFYGPRGLGKREQAMKLACRWIGTTPEDLGKHIDFMMIEPEEGSIRSEQAEKIRQKAMYCPERKAVCVVDGAELMTVDLQNKLLKVLEDAADVLAVIFVSTVPLLDTVMSRCLAVPFVPFGLTRLYNSLGDAPHVAAILASDGCPGVYQRIVGDEKFDHLLTEFLEELQDLHDKQGSIRILELTHALKEKDREYLPEVLDVWQMRAFLSLCRHVYWNLNMQLNGLTGYEWLPKGRLACVNDAKKAEELYFALVEASELSQKKGKFSKNDFFGLLMKMLPS